MVHSNIGPQFDKSLNITKDDNLKDSIYLKITFICPTASCIGLNLILIS